MLDKINKGLEKILGGPFKTGDPWDKLFDDALRASEEEKKKKKGLPTTGKKEIPVPLFI